MEITELLLHTKKNKASDLHLTSQNPPAVRINGDIVPLKTNPLSPDEVKGMIYAIMTEKQRADYERDFEIDFAVQFGEDLRFRVNAFNTLNGPAATFRNIPTKIVSLEELNMPDIFKRMAELNKGLVIVTGPTGSGKSTTLAAILDHVNKTRACHILTIEDPVEYVHKSLKSVVNQRELGTNTISFARALKSALREDPDVILVGEMRDLETIQLALTAAETGHLVLATLHTSSAAKTIDRIIDVFPAGDKELIRSMLSTSLEAVISQTLVKTKDGKGRVAALEILLGTPAIRNLIREGQLPQIFSLMQVGSKVGMRTMKDYLYELVEKDVIDVSEARRVLNIHGEAGSADGKTSKESEGKKEASSAPSKPATKPVSKSSNSDSGGF